MREQQFKNDSLPVLVEYNDDEDCKGVALALFIELNGWLNILAGSKGTMN